MASTFADHQKAGGRDQTSPQNGSSTHHQPNKPKIATFVFMDLEATSLLEGRQKPRIVELCLLAVHRTDLLQASQQGSTPRIMKTPRIMNKLTLCFDPAKPMSFGASEITGLYNDSLEKQSCLGDKTAKLINLFIDHLAKPVCLIAHNGNRFDFPLLKAEFKRIKEEFSNDILCVDSLEAFRSLDGLPPRYEMSANQNHRNNYQGTTPKSTQIIWNKPPGIKRKSEEMGSMETSTKQVKVNMEQFDVNIPTTNNTKLNADKVKKKLFSDEEDNSNKNASATSLQNVVKGELQNRYKPELCEFSASIEDDMLISMLEEVENQSSETSDLESTQEPTDSELSQTDSLKAEKARLAVETGTGYFVCRKGERSVANDQNSKESNKAKHVTKISSLHVNSVTATTQPPNTYPSTSQTQASSSSTEQEYLSLSPSSSSSSSSSSSQHSSSEAALSQVEPRASQSILSSPSILQTSTNSSKVPVVHPSAVANSSISSASTSESNKSPALTNTTSIVTPDRSGLSTSASNHTPLSSVQQSPRLSYKLEQIYIRKFGCRPNVSHSAEDDCVTLLKISCRTPKLMEWLDSNAVDLSSIEAAY